MFLSHHSNIIDICSKKNSSNQYQIWYAITIIQLANNDLRRAQIDVAFQGYDKGEIFTCQILD